MTVITVGTLMVAPRFVSEESESEFEAVSMCRGGPHVSALEMALGLNQGITLLGQGDAGRRLTNPSPGIGCQSLPCTSIPGNAFALHIRQLDVLLIG